MKRSLIAVVALLLLASSATYAAPPRRPRFFLGPVLWWLGLVHHEQTWAPRPDQYGHREHAYAPGHWQMPPWIKGTPYYSRGWHWGWQNGRHYGWERNNPGRREKPRTGGPDQGRGGGHGRS